MTSKFTCRRGEPIVNKSELVAYLASGCKPRDQWRIGTEHEKFAFRLDDLRPLDYDGPSGVRAMLEGLQRYSWDPVFEDGRPIALVKSDHSSVTLEPGGQIELSGAPLKTIHDTCREVGQHLAQVKEVAQDLNIGFLGLGYQPKWPLSEIPWMPKGRYEIMKNYMPKRGSLGLDMMLSSCTVQVNLDFESEACMVQKFRTSLALQPIATALFANSPFTNGKPNGFVSFRSHIWTDTDPDRSGTLPFVFEKGFGFEQYVDYALDVPMYFVYRDGIYVDVTGQSFRDFMVGKLPGMPGELPSIDDWADHITTAFPEVRLKKFLEMRGADGGPWNRLCALPALWVGLLYDDEALMGAWDMIKDWTAEEHEYLRSQVPKTGLKTPFRNETVQQIAQRTVEIARQGLVNRGKLNARGNDESIHLEPLQEIAQSGVTPAEELLAEYHGHWDGNIDNVFKEHAY